MEYQHTIHIMTCGDSTQPQISSKSKFSNSMAMGTLYRVLGVHLTVEQQCPLVCNLNEDALLYSLL